MNCYNSLRAKLVVSNRVCKLVKLIAYKVSAIAFAQECCLILGLDSVHAVKPVRLLVWPMYNTAVRCCVVAAELLVPALAIRRSYAVAM
jgi:hypothetical protein